MIGLPTREFDEPLGEVLADDLLWIHAEDLHDSLTDGINPVLGIHQDDWVGQGVQQRRVRGLCECGLSVPGDAADGAPGPAEDHRHRSVRRRRVGVGARGGLHRTSTGCDPGYRRSSLRA